jgi:hypothetical protein
MCLPGLFSGPKSTPPPPPPQINLPEPAPMPTQADVKQQRTAAPSDAEGPAETLRRRARKSLTISSALGTF